MKAHNNSCHDWVETLKQCGELRAQGLPEEAYALLDTVPQDFDPVRLAALRAQLLTDLGRYDEALTQCDLALATDSGCKDALFTRGFTLFLQERWPMALQTLDTLVTIHPAYPNAAWLRAGIVRRVHGDLEPCVLTAFDLTLKVDAANLYAQTERADILRALGCYPEARDIYIMVSETSEDADLRTEALFKMGCVAMVLQDTDAARDAFRTVFEIAPDYLDAQDMFDMLKDRC